MVTRGPRSPWSGISLAASQGVVVSDVIIRRRCQTLAEVAQRRGIEAQMRTGSPPTASSPGGSPRFARVGSDFDKVTHDAVIAALRRPRDGRTQDEHATTIAAPRVPCGHEVRRLAPLFAL